MAHKQGLRKCFNHNMVEGDSWKGLGNEEFEEDPTGIYKKTRYYCMNPDCNYHYVDSYLIGYIKSKPPPSTNNGKKLEKRVSKPKQSQKANKTLERMKSKLGNGN